MDPHDPNQPPTPPIPVDPYRPPEATLEGPAGVSGAAGLLPWEERGRLGWWPGLFETIKLLLTKPTEAFARARRTGDMASPIVFALILGGFSQVLATIYQNFLPLSMAALLGQPTTFEQFGVLGVVLLGLVGVVMIPVGLFLISGVYHLTLMLLGGLKQSTVGFEGTLRTVSYAYAPFCLSVIPLLGVTVGTVWLVVLYIVGFSEVHQITIGKSVLVTFLPLLFCCGGLLLAGLALGGLAAFAAG